MDHPKELAVVILAAGEGTRMRSHLPKVLHPVCGRPILAYSVQTARQLEAERVLCIIGNGEAEVRRALATETLEFAVQTQRLGTAHAVLQARDLLTSHRGPVLVMCGDHPLFRPESLYSLIDEWRNRDADLALLTAQRPGDSDFGRIVRNASGRLERIVEFHDASNEVRAIREVNLGVYVCDAPLLLKTLDEIGNDNAKGEYYLTEIVPLMLEAGKNIVTAQVEDWDEALGINSRIDLARAEKTMRLRINEHWMHEGVSFVDPDQAYIDVGATVGPDTEIAAGVTIRGTSRIGAGCRLDAGVVIEDSELADKVWIKPHCHVEQSRIGNRCVVGPSAHLRPNTQLGEDVRVGNFVEIKNSVLGKGTKADHLSYIGDADVGEGVTFACGAITVNYDGKQKRRTTVGDEAFVGCNSNLIAPVVIESQAYVAAGSTITHNVESRSLAVGRGRQRVIKGWWDKHFGKGSDSE